MPLNTNYIHLTIIICLEFLINTFTIHYNDTILKLKNITLKNCVVTLGPRALLESLVVLRQPPEPQNLNDRVT